MSNNELKLELDAFQGPFDLLLHLIKQMKVDINDIPMSEITSQYLAYLHSMKEFQLDIAGDYLVMAATLLEIKSRLLLPIEPEPDLEEDYEPEDPRQVLVQQLLLYQQFQDVATALEIKQVERAELYTRPSEDLSGMQTFVPLDEGDITLDQLTAAMALALQKELERVPKQKEINHDPLTVSEKMDEILSIINTLDERNSIEFSDLLNGGNRHEVITTFMAMLELVRKQAIIFKQTMALAPINILKAEGANGLNEVN